MPAWISWHNSARRCRMRRMESVRRNGVALKAPITTPDRLRLSQRECGAAQSAGSVCLRAPVQKLSPACARAMRAWIS